MECIAPDATPSGRTTMAAPAPETLDLTPLLRLPRPALLAALAATFPTAAPPLGTATDVPRGGRSAALERLARIDPAGYARTRNHVDGKVTGLSPWIRHGVLSLAEVRDAALEIAGTAAAAEKLVSELAWRDYWRRVQEAIGDGVRTSIAPPPPGTPAPREHRLPDEVHEAATGLACIDAFVRRLRSTGLLHNHERMWFAAWLVHVRGVDWRAGADWFLSHLVDGDPASNHLSWQWVAGTFSAKPYLARRATIEGCTDGRYCRDCPRADDCPFDAPSKPAADGPDHSAAAPFRLPPAPRPAPAPVPAPRHPLVWLALDSASAESPAARRHPEAPRLYVVEREWLEAERPSLLRLAFLLECLAEVPGVVVLVGDPAELCPLVATRSGCDGVAAADSPCPRFRRALTRIAPRLPCVIHPWPRFVDDTAIRDLGRFSRYWKGVSRSALVPTEDPA